jgi:hypothetical protein
MQISFFHMSLFFIRKFVNSTKFQLLIFSFFCLMGYDTIIKALLISKTFLHKHLALSN